MPSTSGRGLNPENEVLPRGGLGLLAVWALGLTAWFTGSLLSVKWQTSPVLDVARSQRPHMRAKASKTTTEGAKMARA